MMNFFDQGEEKPVIDNLVRAYAAQPPGSDSSVDFDGLLQQLRQTLTAQDRPGEERRARGSVGSNTDGNRRPG